MPQSLTPSGAPARHSGLRLLIWIAGIVAALVVLVMIAAALLVNSNAVTAVVHDKVLPQVSQRIGREVTAGEVKVHILPAPSVRIDDLKVPGETPDRPLLLSKTAIGRLDVGTLLRSFGKKIELASLDLRETEVNLVRHPDGTWSYQPILDRLAESNREQGGGQVPARQVAIGRASMVDGLVRVVDEGAPGGAAVGEIRHVDIDARHIAFGQPLSVQIKAALQSDNRNLEGNFTVDPLPRDLASLGPGTWPKINGQLDVNEAPIGRLRNLLPGGFSEAITGGFLQTHANVSTENGRYVASGEGRASQLELRGQPAQATFQFDGSVDPANRQDLKVDVTHLKVEGPGMDLGGKVSLQGTQRFQFDLSGALLNLDSILAALPEKQKVPGEEAPLLPEAVSKKLQSMEGSGTLDVARVVRGKLTAHDVKVRATVHNGTLRLDQSTAGFYGGTVDGSGSSVDLSQPTPRWNFRGKMEAIQIDQAMTALSGKSPLKGGVSGQLDLVGSGVEWDQLRQALTGTGAVQIHNGALTTGNLEGKVADALSQGLSALGMGKPGEKAPGGGTPLGDMQTRFAIRNGWMALQQPITATAPFGNLSLGGRIGLDKRLDLAGTASLAPGWLAQITGQKALGQAGVPIPLTITGTLDDPQVEGIPTESIARAVLPVGKVEKQIANEANKQTNQALQEAKKKAGEILKGF